MGCANGRTRSPPCPLTISSRLVKEHVPNIGIVTAYNDMLSAHAPYYRYPELIKERPATGGYSHRSRAVCLRCANGITTGMPGMELSCSAATSSLCLRRWHLATMFSKCNIDDGVCDKNCSACSSGFAFRAPAYRICAAGPMTRACPTARSRICGCWRRKAKSDVRIAWRSSPKAYHGQGTCTLLRYGQQSTRCCSKPWELHVRAHAFCQIRVASPRMSSRAKRCAPF